MKQRLHIAIVDPVGVKAGMDQYDISLAQGLSNAGPRVTVISNFRASLSKIRVLRLFQTALKSRYLQVLFALTGYLRSAGWCYRHDVSFVLLHVYHFSRADCFVLRLFRLFRIRIALVIHDVDSFRYRAPDSRKKKIATMADVCFVHHQVAKEELSRLMPGLSINIVPHGHFIDAVNLLPEKLLARKRLGIPEQQFCPLFFGMIKPDKGLDILLQAISKLDSRFTMLVAGRMRGADPDICLKIEQLVLEKRCIAALRYITPHEVDDWMAAADVVVLPYRRIYQSGVAMQAMSRKKPLIVSDLPSFSEWKNNGLVRVFNDGDANHLSEILLTAVAQPQECAQMAEKAFHYLRVAHDWNIVGKEIVATLEQS